MTASALNQVDKLIKIPFDGNEAYQYVYKNRNK